MAITDLTKIAKIFTIFNLPQKDAAFASLGLVTIFGPSGETFDLKGIKDQVDLVLAAATSEEETLIDDAIKEWDDVRHSEQEIGEDDGARGVLFSGQKRRDLIRSEIATILGIWIPTGGFVGQFQRAENFRGGSIMR